MNTNNENANVSANLGDVYDFAASVDAEIQPQVAAALEAIAPKQQRMAHVEPRINRLGSSPEEHAEARQPVEKGALFHCVLQGKELRTSSSGKHYVYITAQLTNGWTMSHTKFLNPKKCDTTENMAVEALKYLQKYGYDPVVKKFDGSHLLAEIGFWESDGKKHWKIDKLFLNEQDREGYYAWLADYRARQQEKQQQRATIEMPEI